MLVPWNLVSASSALKTAAENSPSNVVFKMKLSHCEQKTLPVLGSAPRTVRQAQVKMKFNPRLTEEVTCMSQVTKDMTLRPTRRIRAMQANERPCQGYTTNPARRRRDLPSYISTVIPSTRKKEYTPSAVYLGESHPESAESTKLPRS